MLNLSKHIGDRLKKVTSAASLFIFLNLICKWKITYYLRWLVNYQIKIWLFKFSFYLSEGPDSKKRVRRFLCLPFKLQNVCDASLLLSPRGAVFKSHTIRSRNTTWNWIQEQNKSKRQSRPWSLWNAKGHFIRLQSNTNKRTNNMDSFVSQLVANADK